MMSNGLCDYIKKPFRPEELIETVGKILSEEGACEEE